jgi:hypothetical protein
MCLTKSQHILICFVLQLGSGYVNPGKGFADIVPGFSSGTLAVALGSESTCALFHTGAVSCFGNNYYGQVRRLSQQPLIHYAACRFDYISRSVTERVTMVFLITQTLTFTDRLL